MKDNLRQIIKSTKLPEVKDIKKLLYLEGAHNHFYTSGHVLPQQGTEYVELRNVAFVCNADYIIDAPEYDNLKSGEWYNVNYEPLIKWQVPKVVDKILNDTTTRQAILQFYDPDMFLDKNDMICTMYVSLRFDRNDDASFLTYTVHMRSSDVREFRSDLKWHKKVMFGISQMLAEKLDCPVWCNPIVWYADSLQCWDKDWSYLKDNHKE